MVIETVELKCPSCGAPISLDTKICEYCASPVVIRTVNNFFPSITEPRDTIPAEQTRKHDMPEAFGLFKAKLYDKALSYYESIIKDDFNNSDAHFCAAIAVLKGKRPFIANPSAIKKAEEYLQTAIAIEPKGIYYYLWSYIRLDHHFKKFYKMSPDYKELYSMAIKVGLSPTDVNDLYDALDVERPSEI